MNITSDGSVILHKLLSNIEEQIKVECINLKAREDNDLILGEVDYDNCVITITTVMLSGLKSIKLANAFQDYLNEKFF